MSAHDRLANALESVVGVEWLLTDTATADYAIDGVSPTLVAVPADEAQVAAVLQLADEHRMTVFPHGSGSHMALGNCPASVDVVLSLRRLQSQLAYEPGDMTTTVQAGMRLADLQHTLRPNGQFLALDPSAAVTTTVGGIVAANLSGPRRLLYGSARDLLLGSAVIGINGKRTQAGGRVVKNVTGYDLNKLYIGSLGTLAVIVELTWKVHPLPPGEQTMAVSVTHREDLLPILQWLLQTPLRLNSLVLLNAATVQELAAQLDIALTDAAYVFILRVEGSSQVTSHQAQRLSESLQHLPLCGTATPQRCDGATSEQLWRGIEELPLSLAASEPDCVVSKISLRISEVPDFFHDMQTAASASGISWPVFAHAGHGTAYVRLTSNGEPMLNQIRTLDASVTRLHGRRVIEYAPVAVKRQCDVWGTPGDDFALMRAIKTSFDPHNRLNPGRFIGGL
jgi:glycolate oxidase FAD binding subunit